MIIRVRGIMSLKDKNKAKELSALEGKREKEGEREGGRERISPFHITFK
jgi:hypothetical protein